jgi:cation transport regulator ChaB
MSKLTEKTTIYLNPYVKKFIQLTSIQENKSMSEVINEQMADLLQDLEDAHELSSRKEDAVFVPWTEVKKQLQKDGKL